MPSALCRPASFGSAALVLSLVCSLASGRQPVGPGQLPCELASKQSLDGGDEAAIRQFIATHAPGLTSDDAEAISKSREAMLSPLGCAGITFAFRSKYADLLTPVLTPIAGSKEEIQAVNALLVLGRLRTTLSSDALSGSLKAGNPVIRFAAASGYRDLLSQLSKDSFGFPESAIDRILDAVSSALKVEADPLAADIMTVALGEATRGSAGLRGRAMLRLTDAMGRRLQTLRKEASIDPAWSRTLLRSLDVARQAMLEQGGAGAIDKEFAKRAAVFSGQVFVFANDWVAKGMRSEETELSRAVAAAEGLAVIAHGAASGQRVPEKGLQRIFDSSVAAGKAGEFTAAIQSWVGADGLLLKSPYSAPASEFAPAK